MCIRDRRDLRHGGDRLGQRERRREIGGDRIDAETGEVLAQAVGLGFQEIARDVDRHIGCEVAVFEQQPHLGGGAGAELDQRSALGDDRCDLTAAVAQDAELGAGRIIFRQHGDLFEQLRAGGVVEILRRQPFRVTGEIADHVAGKGRGRFVGRIRFGQSGGMHIHDTLLNALTGAHLMSTGINQA